MDIRSSGSYPANKLSNFAPHRFVFDGVECRSMEGLLQSFKTKSPEKQGRLSVMKEDRERETSSVPCSGISMRTAI